MTRSRYPHRGFSIVELLVAIAIIALLLALILTAVMSSRQAARKISCLNNIRQIGLALHNYHDQFSLFPPAAIWNGPPGEPLGRARIPIGVIDRVALGSSATDPDRSLANWLVMLLPQLGEAALWTSYNATVPVSDPSNAVVRSTSVPILQCPDDPFSSSPYVRDQIAGGSSNIYARGNYAMNFGPGSRCIFELDPNCTDGSHVDNRDLLRKNTVLWGTGAGGFNKSFSLKDFTGGTSSFVMIDELRAGVYATDPRGSWALGFVGASITSRHGLINSQEDANGPNNQNSSSDEITGCTQTGEALGTNRLAELRMPCRTQKTELNSQATSRSMHP